MKNYMFRQCHFFTINGAYFVFVTSNLRLYEVERENYDKLLSLYSKWGYNDEILTDEDGLLEELEEHELVYDTEALEENLNSEKLEEEDDSLREESDTVKEESDSVSEESGTVSEENPVVKHPSISNIVLQVANDCNLNCKYCYGQGGTYNRVRELMNFDTAKKSIDFMIENSDDLKELLVTFFGGEPLMNFKLIKKVIAYCDEIESKTNKRFIYSMTTNGTIISDEIIDYIKRYRIATMLSMDGPKDIQDCYRCHENGAGSFDQIIPNIDKFRDARGGHLTVRSTICKPNMDMVRIRKELLDLGFTNVVMSPVDISSDSDLFVGGESSGELSESYYNLALSYIEDFKETAKPNSRYFDEMLKALYFKNARIRSCNAGNNGLAVGSDGNLYPCHRFMGMNDYIVGNIHEGIDRSQTDVYKHSNVHEKEDCKECWARYLCGGGCLHICVSQEEDPMKAPRCYCDTYRSTFEVILYIYHELKAWDDDVFRKMLEEKKETMATIK